MTKVEQPRALGVQTFTMVRNNDETGTSGTGPVADGAVFPNGTCVVMWRGAVPCVQVWDSFSGFERIHIDAHPTNNTEVLWS